MGLERLESRILFTVTSSLNAGVLDIQLTDPGDTAVVSQTGSTIQVFGGATTANYSVGSVTMGVNAQGNNQANQTVNLETLQLSIPLTVAEVTTVGLSGNLTFGSVNISSSGTVAVASNTVLSTRQTTGTDPLTDPSTGNSGDLILAASTITVGDKAALLAQADNGFSGGNVTLTAMGSVNASWYLGISGFETETAAASVTLGAVTIEGNNVTATAAADSSKSVDLSSSPSNPLLGPVYNVIENAILPFQTNAAAAVSEADATVTIGAAATIQAANNVSFQSQATSAASITTSATEFGVTYGSSTPTATITVTGGANGATISAGNTFDMQATTTNTLAVTAVVPNGGDTDNVSFAYGHADSTSSADVQTGATITARGDASVQADNTNNFLTQTIAAGFNQSTGTGVGATVAIGDYQSSATATVGGKLTATGSVTVAARSINTTNITRSFAAVSSSTGASSLLAQVSNYLSSFPLNTTVNGSTLSPTGTAQAVEVGGAVVIDVSGNTANASIGDGGQVSADGDLTVNAQAEDNIQISAAASAGDATQTSVGGAVVVSLYTNTANAFLGKATVDTPGTLNVSATATVPNQVPTTLTPTIDTSHTDTATGTDQIGEQYTDGGVVGNKVSTALAPLNAYLAPLLASPTVAGTSYVDSRGTVAPGGSVGIGGGIKWLTVTNNANAYVSPGAKVNQSATSATQDVTVQANATVQSVNLAGQPSAQSYGGGGAGPVGVGGFIDKVTFNNTASAYIADGATVSAGRNISVTANTSDYLLDAVVAGAEAQSLGVDGAFIFDFVTNQTLAYVEAGAVVNAGQNVMVTAANQGEYVNIAGGLAEATNVGVGVSATFNIVNNTTQAVIGDMSGSTATGGSVQAGGNVNLDAQTTQTVWNLGVAGAVGTNVNYGSGGVQTASSGQQYGLGVSGDLAFNFVTDMTQALVVDGVPITAGNDLDLQATDNSVLPASAGGQAFANDIGIGGSVALNSLNATTQAETQNTTLNVAAISLQASSTNQFATLANGGSGATAKVNVGGSVDLNSLNNDVEAGLGDGTNTTTSGTVLVGASNTTQTLSAAGVTSSLTNGTPGVGAALDISGYGDTVRAFLGNGNLQAGGNVQVLANSTENIDSITAALDEGPQGGFGVGGSISTNTVTPTVQAFVQGTVNTPQSLYVNAADSPTVAVLAGGAASGVYKGVGASILNVNVNPTINAYIDANANVTVGGNGSGLFDPAGSGFGGNGITLHAVETDQVLVYASGVAESAADLAVAASAIIDTMTSDVEACVASGATVNGSEAGASTAQSVLVAADQSTSVLSVADDYGNAKQKGYGAALDGEKIDRTVKAYIAPSATVNAQGNVVVTATSSLNADVALSGTAGAGEITATGSVASLSYDTDTEAYIDQSANVTAQNNVSLAAGQTTTINTNVGAPSFDGLGGVGFANCTTFNTDVTKAFVATGAHVLANGNGAAIAVLTGQKDSSGNELTTPLNGVSLTATSYENVTPVTAASNGQYSPQAGVAASTTFTVLDQTTQAYVDSGAIVNSSLSSAASDQVVNVVAADTTTLIGGAGIDTSSNLAGFGAGVDVGSITKNTEAFVSGTVNAALNVLIQASSLEHLASIAGNNQVAGLIGIAAAGSVYTLNATTKAYVGNGAVVMALGNVLVSSIDSDQVALINDLSNASLITSVGGALGVANISKDTEAYIGNATVNALGNGSGVVANNGAFTTQFVPDSGSPDQVASPGFHLSGVLDQLLGKTVVTSIPDDPALYNQRTVTPQTQTVTGVAVSAISTDHVAHRTEGFGSSVGGTVQGSLASAVVGNLTSAYIGASAQVNQATDANANQGVLVAAGSDAFGLGISGIGSVAGLATVGPAGDTWLIGNKTTAYIGNGAAVTSQTDVQVLATASEYVVSYTAGFGAAIGISVVPSLVVISLSPITLAFIDQNAVVNAQGNVLVQAQDNTHTDILTGSLGASFLAAVGAAVGATFLTKDTEAYVGAGATVNADAHGPGIPVFSGTINGTNFDTAVIHGVGVEASSTENMVTTAGSGGAGIVDLVGAASAQLDSATTKAYIDNNAQINQNTPDADPSQTVNVAAVNSVNSLGTVANLSGGLLSLAGSVDLGIIRNTTLAYTNPGAIINARNDIDVFALASKMVQSQTGGAGVAVAGIDGSLAIYSIGAILDQNTQDLLATSPTGSIEQFIDNAIQQLAYGASSGFATILNAYAGAIEDQTMAAATNISGSTPAGEVTAAVTSTTPTQGTAAFVNGSSLHADHDVNVQGTDNLNTAADTSFTFAISLSPVPLTLNIDAAVIATHGGAQAYVQNGADVGAGQDVNILAASDNQDNVVATLAKNNLASTVTSYVDGSTVTATGAVNVNAATMEEATGNTSYLPGFAGLQVRLAQNTINDSVDAHVSNSSTVNAGTTLQIQATSGGTIKAIGVAVGLPNPITGSVYIGIGAAASMNQITGSTTAYIDQSQATAPTVTVTAIANPDITAINVGGSYSSAFTADGSASDNTIQQTIDAYVADNSTVQATTSLAVTATDGATIVAVAGSGAGSGGVAFGGSVSANDITDTASAYVDNSTATAPVVQVLTNADPSITAIAVGGQGADGVVAGGSGASNMVTETLLASLQSSTVNAATSVDLEANDSATIVSVAGNGEGATGVAIGGSLSSNTITTNVEAQIAGGQITTPVLTFQATTGAHITSIAVSGGGAVGFAAGGSDSSNTVGGTIQAVISTNAVLTITNPVDLKANDDATIVSVAGNGQGATGVAVGASASTNTINPTIEAQISNAQINAPSLTLDAEISSHITSVAAAGGGATGVAAGGGLSRNNITPTVEAEISGGQVTAPTVSLSAQTTANIVSVAAGGGGAVGVAADGADSANSIGGTIAATVSGATVIATTSLNLQAHDGATILSVAGNGEGGVGVSLGGSISNNTINVIVQAEISGGQANTPAVTVMATSDGNVTSLAVGGGGAVGVAANGSDSSNTIGGSITSSAVGTLTVGTSLDVEAHGDSTIVSVAGAGTGAVGVAVAGALSNNDVTTAVQASIDTGTVGTPTVTLLAESSSHITSIAVSGSGGVGVAAGGSDSSNTIGSSITATISGATVTATTSIDTEAHEDAVILSVAGNGEGAVGVAVGASVSTNTINPTVDAQNSNAQINAPSLTLNAEISSHITSVAAAGGGAVGVAAGAGLSRNNITPTVEAEISGGQVTAPTVSLSAQTTANIVSVAAGGGGAVGVALDGADSANSIGGTIAATISGATVIATTSLNLQAHDGATILSVAGNGEGGVGVSIGGSISNNTISSALLVQISSSQVTASTATLLAYRDGKITSIAVGGGGAVGVAANGSDSSNTIGGSITATVSGGTGNISSSLSLEAHEDATILSVAGNGTGAIGVAIAGGLSNNTITTNVETEISGAQINAPTVTLLAHSDANIKVIAVGGAGAVGVALTGSDSINTIGGSIIASIDSGAAVTASTSLSLTAHENAQIFALGGNGSGAVGVAFGAAITNNTINPTVQARIDSSNATAPSVVVLATSNAQIQSIAIGGSGAYGGAVGDSTANNDIGSMLDAQISGGAVVNGTNGVTVTATDVSSISAIGGGAGGAVFVGTGLATTTDTIQNTVTAFIDNATVTASAGNIGVSATSTPSITSFGIAGGGAVGAGIAFTVANATISTTTDAHLSNGANLNASGAVSVQSQFTPSTNISAGSLSGAFIAGFGASDVEVTLSSHTNASATTGAVVVAGGTVAIGADSNANSLTIISVVGQGAILAANAAIAHVNSSNNASASIASGAAINNATSVTVDAQTTSNPVAHAYGAVFGIVAAGGTSSSATESGTSSASVDGGIIGGGSGGQQVGALTVSATATTPVEAKSWAGGLGVLGATINSATASAKPTVQASIDDGANVQTTGSVGVTSDAETGANTYVFALSIGGLTAGLSQSNATDAPVVRADVGASVNAGGNINLQATHNTNGGGGAQAGAESPGISLVGYAGADPNATTGAQVSSIVNPGGSLNAGGGISITTNSNNIADAEAHSFFGGALGAGTSTPGTVIEATTLTAAEMNGTVTGATSLTISSQASSTGTAHGGSVSVGLLNGEGVVSNTQVSPTTQASIGDGTNAASVQVSGNVAVTAQSLDNAIAQSDGFIAGFLCLGIVNASATLTPTVATFIGRNSNVTSTNGCVTLQAFHNYNLNGSLAGDGAQSNVSASGGGLISVENTIADATADANVQTHIDAGASVHAGGDVVLLSQSDNSANGAATSGSGGIINAYGGVSATMTANGTTQAYLSGINTLMAGGNLTVEAEGTNATTSNAHAASGGVINVDGSNASADDAPNVLAALSSTNLVQVGGTTSILGLALGNASADGTGAGGGVVEVGTSHASASWDPTVEANIGAGTTLQSGNDIDVQAMDNYDEAGNLDMSRQVQASASATVGGVITIEGAHVDLGVNSIVNSHIGAGATVSAGNNLNINALAFNQVSGNVDGTAGGLGNFGSADANAAMSSQTLAGTDDASGSPTVLSAPGQIQVFANADNVGNVNGEGSGGGLIGSGGVDIDLHLDNPLVQARLGNFTTVTAGGTFQLLAQNQNNLMADANQTTIGVFQNNEVDVSAVVNGSQTLAELGTDDQISANQILIVASDASLHANASGYANVPLALDGNNTAKTNADENANAKVLIGTDSQLTSTTSLNIYAMDGDITTSSNPTTHTLGGAGNLYSIAESNKILNTQVVTDNGSSLTGGSVSVEAQQPSDESQDTYVRNPQVNAQTLTALVADGVETVCTIVGNVVCLWGLICNPTSVCQTITRFVEEIFQAVQDPEQTGSQSETNSVDLNSDITIKGQVSHTLTVNSAGQVTQLSNLVATDGVNPLSAGETVGTNSIYVTQLLNGPTNQLAVEAPGGSTSGHSNVEFDAFSTVTIQNASTKDLYLDELDVIDVTNPPSITQVANADQENWTYTLSTQATGGSVSASNTNAAGGNLFLLGNILNPVGVTDLVAAGGSITAASASTYIRTRTVDLDAGNGTLGTSNQPLVLQMIDVPNSPTAIEQALGTDGVFLDVTPASDMTMSLAFDIENVSAINGDVVINIDDGVIADENNVLNSVTLTDGTVLNGTILMNTSINPATAVNNATGTVNLGYVDSMNTGEEVSYLTNGGQPIGGLFNGGVYRVIVVNPTTIQLGDTFDAATAVDPATSTIAFPQTDDLTTGTPVVYDSPGGTAIGGLVSGQIYYVRVIDGQTIKLASSLAEAEAAPQYFSVSSAVDPTTSEINFGVADGFTPGEAVTYRAQSYTPIQGLTDGDTYYAIVLNSTTIQLAVTKADALAATPKFLPLDPTNATGLQSIGDEGIPLDPTGATGTQSLYIALDNSVATGTDHQFANDSFYIQTSSGLVRVPYADVAINSVQSNPTLTSTQTTVTLQNISSSGGNITIAGGSSNMVKTDLILTDLISSPNGTTTISTLSGDITNGGSPLITAQDIDLSAPDGVIGSSTANILTDLGSGHLIANAEGDIYVTNFDGALRPGQVTSTTGNIVLTVYGTAAGGEDMILDSTANVDAEAGAVTLQAGDNVYIDAGSLITALGIVSIYGDYNDTEAGSGSTMNIFGTIEAVLAQIFGNAAPDIVTLSRPDTTPTDVFTYDGADTVNVEAMNGPMSVDTGSGNDTINVGSTGDSLAGIQATLTIDGSSNDATPTATLSRGSDSHTLPIGDVLNINDQGDNTQGVVYDLSSTQFQRLDLPDPIDYQNVETITLNTCVQSSIVNVANTAADVNTTINGNVSGNTVNVRATGSNSNVVVNTGKNNSAVYLQTTGAGSFTELQGGGGNDTFFVGSDAATGVQPGTGSLDGINGVLSVDAAGGNGNRLILDNFQGSPNQNVIFTNNKITGLSPATIYYTATGGIYTDGPTQTGAPDDGILIFGSNLGADTFNVESTLSGSSTKIVTGQFNDTFNVYAGASGSGVGSTAAMEAGATSGIQGFLNIDAGTGTANRLIVSDFANTTSADVVTLTNRRIVGLAPAEIDYATETSANPATVGNFSDPTGARTFDGILLLGPQGGGNTFNIQSTLGGSTTQIQGDGGEADYFNVYSDAAGSGPGTSTATSNVLGVLGKLTLLGGTSTTNRIIISDKGDNGSASSNLNLGQIIVTDHSILNLAPGFIYYSAANPGGGSTPGNFTDATGAHDGLWVQGSLTAPNTYLVYRTLVNGTTELDGGANNDSFNFGAELVTSVANPDTTDTSLPATFANDQGDLNYLKGLVTVVGNGGNDSIEADDHGPLYTIRGVQQYATNVNGTPILTEPLHDNDDGIPAINPLQLDYGYNYLVTPNMVVNDSSIIVHGDSPPTQSVRPFAGIVYNTTSNASLDSVTFVRLDGTDRTNRFAVTPDSKQVTTFMIDGNMPNASTRLDGGDYLDLNTTQLANTFARNLHIFTVPNSFFGTLNGTTYYPDLPASGAGLASSGKTGTVVPGATFVPAQTTTGVDTGELASPTGNGFWNFTRNGITYAKPVYFLSIEQFNHVAIVATVSAPLANSNQQPIVTVRDAETGDIKFTIAPYETYFHGGVNVAVGDVTGDGIPDLIVAPEQGHDSLIKIYNGTPNATGQYPGTLVSSFLAFSSTFLGGASIAVGDVNRDAYQDLVVGAGPGIAPLIEVFNGKTLFSAHPTMIGSPFDAFQSSFHEAIDQNFHGGVNVAVGDLNNDGYADIVATVASNGPPIVNVFNGNGFGFLRGFNAFNTTSFPGGLSLAVGDVDGDGIRDIVVGSAPGDLPEVAIFSGMTLFNTSTILPEQILHVPSSNVRGAVMVQAEPANGGNPGTVENDRVFVELFQQVLTGEVATPIYDTLTPFDQKGATSP